MKKTIVIGVTSGIAAYKTVDLIKMLKKEGIDIFVIMTKSATKMISPLQFEKVTSNPVYTELFEKGFNYKTTLHTRKVDHIALADKANVFIIVPATANCIGKIAHGMADDFLTTTALAITCPKIICPAMNANMWTNPAVQNNIEILKKYDWQIIKPAKGMLACGYEGIGRLEDLKIIRDEIMRQLETTSLLAGKNILVTSGGTEEKIDDVRYIKNRSSGKMGVAIAEACFERGANVQLVRAKDSLRPRYQIPEQTFTTAEELFHLIKTNVAHFDIIFHVAAVSDFKLTKIRTGKIPGNKPLTLHLEPQIKIINTIRQLNRKIKIIAFKAEFGVSEKKLIESAKKLLHTCNADMIVANDVGKKDRSFGSNMNQVIIVSADNSIKKTLLKSKYVVAKTIVDYVS